MKKVVLVCAGFATGNFCSAEGQYLKSYDPEAHGGRGDAEFTTDRSRAMVFADVGEALELWKAVPKRRPLREDGKPNRPLTAFSMVTEAADD